jgi:phage tail sheath protein FI
LESRLLHTNIFPRALATRSAGFRPQDEDPRPVAAGDLSTVGLIGPASKADPSVFPLNAPIKVYSNDVAKLRYLGNSGYLLDALRGINDQLDALQVAAQVVVVRTAEGTDPVPAFQSADDREHHGGSTAPAFPFPKSPAALACRPDPRAGVAQMANSLNTLELTTPGKATCPERLTR